MLVAIVITISVQWLVVLYRSENNGKKILVLGVADYVVKLGRTLLERMFSMVVLHVAWALCTTVPYEGSFYRCRLQYVSSTRIQYIGYIEA